MPKREGNLIGEVTPHMIDSVRHVVNRLHGSVVKFSEQVLAMGLRG